MGIISSILDIFFPPKCIFCRKILGKNETGWCLNCFETLPFTSDNGRQKGEVFDICVSPLYYIENVRRSLLRYKFNGAYLYSDIYAKLLAECIKSSPDLKYDLISWVPLSEKRKRKRGYDQAMLLALATALLLDDVAAVTLEKRIDVSAQSELGDKKERASNISGAYVATDPDIVKDKRILLIDDIVTTSSTLDECSRALLSAGASGVVCAVVARGE